MSVGGYVSGLYDEIEIETVDLDVVGDCVGHVGGASVGGVIDI